MDFNKTNRWVILAELIPWDQFEDKYAARFAGLRFGRLAMKASLAKENLITDYVG